MKKAVQSFRNLLERIKIIPQHTIAVETNVFSRESSLKSLSNEDLSLSERRRDYYCKQPIENERIKSKFLKAKVKLRGYKLWNQISYEVKNFGTNSNLLDAHELYRQNLKDIMENKKRKVYNDFEQPATDIGWLFHPDSTFKYYWYFVILIAVLYVVTGMPLVLAFIEVRPGSGIFIFETIIDFIFFIDMIIIFNSAFINSKGLIEINRWQIFLNYLTGFFIFDFLAIFPFWVFSDVDSPKTHSLTRIIRLTKLTRILRISKIVPIIRSIIDSKSLSSLLDLILSFQGTTRLITITYSIILIAHFISCIWYFIAKIEGIYPDSWIAKLNVDEDRYSTLYLRGIYFAFTVMNTVGFGDIHPSKIPEIAVCIVIMMFGICFYSFLVATLTSILSSLDIDTAKLNSKKSILDELQLKYSISIKLKKEIHQYIKRAKHGDLNVFMETIYKLPRKLQYFLCMSMHKCAPASIRLFLNSEERFAVEIIPQLTVRNYHHGETIYAKGSLPYELYLVSKGRVNIVFGSNNMEIKTFPTGSYFGEVELIKCIPRKFTALAENCTQLLTISSKLFSYILIKYPKVRKEIMEKADVQEMKDTESFNEILNVIEITDVVKTMSVEDLAGEEQILGNMVRGKTIPPTMYFRRTLGSFMVKTNINARKNISLELQDVRNEIDNLCCSINKILNSF